MGQPGFAAIGGEGDAIEQARQALGVAWCGAVGLGQGDEAGFGQGRAFGALLKPGEIIDGELARHGVGEQQVIVVRQGQPARGLGSFCIQLELARAVVGVQAS
ncbi:hypothetical protein D3C76_1398360 [compost metagenome]